LIYECRYRMLTKSGDIQWCLDRGRIISYNELDRPTRMIGVNVNVTPMIKWEQSLIVSEQQLKAMIQSLPTPVTMLDKNLNYLASSSRWIDEWNEYWSPLEGTNARKNFSEDWIQNMEKALTGLTLSQDEDLVEMAPGVEVWIRWIIQPWKNANEQI